MSGRKIKEMSARQKLRKFTSQLSELEVILYIEDTIWKNVTTKFPFLSCIGLWYTCISSHYRNIFYAISIFALAVSVFIVNDIIANILIDILTIVVLCLMFFDMNYLVFTKLWTRFEMYYKMANVAIGIAAHKILSFNGYNQFTCNSCGDIDISNGINHEYLNLLKMHTYLSVVSNVCIMCLLSFADGYWMRTRLKITALVGAIGYYCYVYYIVYFQVFYDDNNDKEFRIAIFGKDYNSLQSVAATSLFSVIVFATRQLYFIVMKPKTLALVPTVVQFQDISVFADNYHSGYSINSINGSEIRNDINRGHRVSTVSSVVSVSQTRFFVEIEKKETILYKILLQCCCTCCCGGGMNEISVIKIRNIMYNKWWWLFSLLYFIFYFTLAAITNHKFAGWIDLIFNVIQMILIILAILNVNFLSFQYSLRSFVFWWKMQDVIVLTVLEVMVDYQNKSSQFSLKYNDIAVAWLISIPYVFVPVFVVMLISMIFGVFIHSRIKIFIIVLAIAFFIRTAFVLWIDDDEVDFIIYSYQLDCNSTIIAKAVDIIVWFIVQLIDQIRYNNAVIVSGKVKAIWVNDKNEQDKNEKLIDDDNHVNEAIDMDSFVLMTEKSNNLGLG